MNNKLNILFNYFFSLNLLSTRSKPNRYTKNIKLDNKMIDKWINKPNLCH